MAFLKFQPRLTNRMDPPTIVGRTRQILRRAMPQVDADRFHIHSSPLPTDRQKSGALARLEEGVGHTNVLTISPPEPKRVVFIEDGNNGSVATAAVGLLPPLLLNETGNGFGDTAVVYHENLGHAPHVDPVFSVAAMFDAFIAFYKCGLWEAYEALSFLQGLPIHELGFSRGAGFMVYAHELMMTESGPHAIFTSENDMQDLATSTLVSPAIRMNRLMEGLTLLSFLLYITPESMIRWPFPPGVDKKSLEGQLIAEFTKQGLREEHMGQVFAQRFCGFVREMAYRLRTLEKQSEDPVPYPPTFLALSRRGDNWIDLDEARRYWDNSLQADTGRHALYEFSGHHNPFGSDEGKKLLRQVRLFWERNERGVS